MQKKTYMLDEETLNLLEELKCMSNKKEITIIKESIKLYHQHHVKEDSVIKILCEITNQLVFIINKIEDLSRELGKCEERNRYLENQIKKLSKNNVK